MCIRHRSAPDAAATAMEPGSPARAVTSLMILAPASTAAPMTWAWRVSMETMIPFSAKARITGVTRRAKLVLIGLGDRGTLAVPLKMTGRLLVKAGHVKVDKAREILAVLMRDAEAAVPEAT